MFNRVRRTIRALKSSSSGNAALLVALGMPALIGGAGLAVDTAQWYMWKRELQFAVDQAALAGAWARTDAETEALYEQRALQELTSNLSATSDFLDEPSVSIEDYADGNDNSVMVTASATKRLPFSSFLTGNDTTVYASAQASFGEGNTFSACILAVNESDSGAIIIQGSVTLAQSCGIAALSISDEAITRNGEASDPGTGELTARGGIDDDFDDVDGLTINEYVDNLFDPYEDLTPPLDNTPQSYSCQDVTEEIGFNYNRQVWSTERGRRQQYSSPTNTAPTASSTWTDVSDGTYPFATDGTKVSNGVDSLPSGSKVNRTYTTSGTWVTQSTTGPVETTSTVKVNGRSVTATTYTWTRIQSATDSNTLYTTAGKTKNSLGQIASLAPGTYAGGFHVKCNTNLNGGIYVIDGGSLKVNSQDLLTSSSGVMFVLKNGATININGGAGISLRPMSKAELDLAINSGNDMVPGSNTELLAGMLIMELANSGGSGLNQSNINGNAGLTLNGTVYLPKTELDMSGTAGVSSQCLMIAANKIKFSGDMEFTSLCPSDNTDDTDTAGVEVGSTGGGVRLVA